MSGGRISVRTNEDTVQRMDRLTTGDKTATEIIRRAIALLDFVEMEQLLGKKLALLSEDGTTETVRMIW